MSEIAAERARIARELHDGIAQELAAIGYALDAEIGRSDTSQASRSELRQIRNRITELNSDVRDEIFMLRSIRKPSPQFQLQQVIAELEIPIQITGELPDDLAGETLTKVLQEILRNAKAHTVSPVITIEIKLHEITIINSSRGEAVSDSSRFGVIGVRERLRDIGWTIEQSSDFTSTYLRRND